MSDDEDFKKSNEQNKYSNKYINENMKTLNDNKDNNIIIKYKNYNNSKNNKFRNKVKNNFINNIKDLNNSNIDTENKNIQTQSKNIKNVDCNLVNLNLLDIPNINDNNKSNDSNNNDIFFRNFNGRKIYKNNKFLSSKNIEMKVE